MIIAIGNFILGANILTTEPSSGGIGVDNIIKEDSSNILKEDGAIILTE